jgi:hypothetical protein
MSRAGPDDAVVGCLLGDVGAPADHDGGERGPQPVKRTNGGRTGSQVGQDPHHGSRNFPHGADLGDEDGPFRAPGEPAIDEQMPHVLERPLLGEDADRAQPIDHDDRAHPVLGNPGRRLGDGLIAHGGRRWTAHDVGNHPAALLTLLVRYDLSLTLSPSVINLDQ